MSRTDPGNVWRLLQNVAKSTEDGHQSRGSDSHSDFRPAYGLTNPETTTAMSGARQNVKTVSCAECRRLKLKCDRVFPCASCRKRGCGDLCPTGSLPTRPRAVFQETERLKNKISLLTSRVHDLENALSRLQARVSPTDTHPLLSEELLVLSREPEDQENREMRRKKSGREDHSRDRQQQASEVGDDDELHHVKESLGTLALHSDGRSKFFGPTAGIESLFHNDFNDNEGHEHPLRSPSPVPPSGLFLGPPTWIQDEIDMSVSPDGPSPASTTDSNRISASAASPGAISCSDSTISWIPNWFTSSLPAEMVGQVLGRFERHLPGSTTALSLCDTFYEHAAWLHCGIPRQDFIEDVFSHIYEPGHPESRGSLTRGLPASSPSPVSTASVHAFPEKAAIFFMVLAIGCMLDLTVPAGHAPTLAQAEQYHELACAAMGIGGVVERGSVRSVQCLMLMAYYHLLLDKPNSPQRCWALIGLNVHIAQLIGLHRDSGWWNPDPEDVQRRRETFWELFALERLQVLTLGLPPSLALQHIDCEFPEDLSRITTATGVVHHSFQWKKKKWTREVVADVIDALLVTPKTPVPYAKILALDRKLRDDLVLNARDVFSGVSAGIASTLQDLVHNLVKETTLILLHRRYFARALNTAPRNLFGSKYGPSVLASYRSACHLVGIHRTLAATGSTLPSRIWFLWNHLLGAAIVLAALATKNPWCTIAPGALAELDAAHALFENGAKAGGVRPAKARAITDRLRAQARGAFEDMRSKGVGVSTPNPGCNVGTAPELEHLHSEDLSILSGGRVIKEIPKRHNPQTVVTTSSSPQGRSVPPSSERQPTREGQTDAVLVPTSHESSPLNIFDTLHPELMEDLRVTNKVNEANFPNMDWSFSELAQWNNVQGASTATGVSHASDVPAPGFEASEEMSMSANMSWANTYGFDAPFNAMEAQAGREDLSLVAGSMAWDPSWRSLMDQLGVAELHTV